MPVLITSGIVCALRAHGEHGAVARLLTPDHGLVAGYVRGGRSRALRPVLLPGNAVKAGCRFSVKRARYAAARKASDSRTGLVSRKLKHRKLSF